MTVTGLPQSVIVILMPLFGLGIICNCTSSWFPSALIQVVAGTGFVASIWGTRALAALAVTVPATFTTSTPSMDSRPSVLAPEKFARILARPLSGVRIVVTS